MSQTKKEMMKEAMKMGIEMGAAGCVMVVTAEEMEKLLLCCYFDTEVDF